MSLLIIKQVSFCTRIIYLKIIAIYSAFQINLVLQKLTMGKIIVNEMRSKTRFISVSLQMQERL
jgi:hypothetical protein